MCYLVRCARRLAQIFGPKYAFTVKFVIVHGFAENVFTTTIRIFICNEVK